MNLRMNDVFAMDLERLDKLFLLYLYGKGAHREPLQIQSLDIEKELAISSTQVWRVSRNLKNAGLLKTKRAFSNAVTEYEIVRERWIELSGRE